jgi:hypothetical protein
MPTRVRSGHEKFFRAPIDSVMAVFPIIFWETIRDEVKKYPHSSRLPRGKVKWQ